MIYPYQNTLVLGCGFKSWTTSQCYKSHPSWKFTFEYCNVTTTGSMISAQYPLEHPNRTGTGTHDCGRKYEPPPERHAVRRSSTSFRMGGFSGDVCSTEEMVWCLLHGGGATGYAYVGVATRLLERLIGEVPNDLSALALYRTDCAGKKVHSDSVSRPL